MSSNNQGTRLSEALRRIDAVNAQDPNKVFVANQERPKELVYGEQMTAWLTKFAPDASDALQLAARAQHIKRWVISRASYPEGRQGYKQWRADLGKFHAETAGVLLQESGYDAATIARVKTLLRKEKFKADPEGQILEDVACLVFLEAYFADFARRYSDDSPKIIEIVRKTWAKMSEHGHAEALKLPLPAEAMRIVKLALEK